MLSNDVSESDVAESLSRTIEQLLDGQLTSSFPSRLHPEISSKVWYSVATKERPAESLVQEFCTLLPPTASKEDVDEHPLSQCRSATTLTVEECMNPYLMPAYQLVACILNQPGQHENQTIQNMWDLTPADMQLLRAASTVHILNHPQSALPVTDSVLPR